MARFLVTAGPTREPIDPVRFLSNRSSGRMGYAVCNALLELNHEVILISGPVNLDVPVGVKFEQVETAEDMLSASLKYWRSCDGLFATAAVSDYRLVETYSEKLKRENSSLQLDLVPNPDIVKTLADSRGKNQLLIGWALESESGLVNAKQKLKSKQLDFICLNSPISQNSEVAELTVIGNCGLEEHLGPYCKDELARKLIDIVLPA